MLLACHFPVFDSNIDLEEYAKNINEFLPIILGHHALYALHFNIQVCREMKSNCRIFQAKFNKVPLFGYHFIYTLDTHFQ